MGYRDNAKPDDVAAPKPKHGLVVGFGIAGAALALVCGIAIGRRYESKHPAAPPPCRNHAVTVGPEAAFCDPDQDAQLVNGQVLFCTCRRK
ncbi:MAG TPA: hypothetical protein VFA98_09350 [Thermoanaerobaculia bacterium]|nr:hypothetical protein [Thermoanaerobaculia bacterium]